MELPVAIIIPGHSRNKKKSDDYFFLQVKISCNNTTSVLLFSQKFYYIMRCNIGWKRKASQSVVSIMCKVANKCLNVRELVEVVEWKKMVPSLPLLSCELSVFVKENPDRKKKTLLFCSHSLFCNQMSLGRKVCTLSTLNWQTKMF